MLIICGIGVETVLETAFYDLVVAVASVREDGFWVEKNLFLVGIEILGCERGEVAGWGEGKSS